MKIDAYYTLAGPSPEVVFKDRNSKFYGYGFPINSEVEVKDSLEDLKKLHHSARHFCYAYQLGFQEPEITFRTNDDGEPNNSAGMPIYGQITSFELSNVLVVVVRYFGGTKLGVGGLINAYKTTAEMVLKNSRIVKKLIREHYLLTFAYEDMNDVMRIIKDNDFSILNNESGFVCKLEIGVRLNEVENMKRLFENLYKVKLKLKAD